MSSKTVIMYGDENADYFYRLLKSVPKDRNNPKFVARIETYEKAKTRAQNAYNWLLNGFLSNHARFEFDDIDPDTGEIIRYAKTQSKEGWHYHDARMFLDPVAYYDPIEKKELIIPGATSTLGNKKYADFLNKKIAYWETERRLILPNPQELHWGIR